MDKDQDQDLNFVLKDSLRKRTRTRTTTLTISQDLKTIGMSWEQVEESAANREDWRRSVAQFDYDDTG